MKNHFKKNWKIYSLVVFFVVLGLLIYYFPDASITKFMSKLTICLVVSIPSFIFFRFLYFSFMRNPTRNEFERLYAAKNYLTSDDAWEKKRAIKYILNSEYSSQELLEAVISNTKPNSKENNLALEKLSLVGQGKVKYLKPNIDF